jgi:MFS family permease
MLAASVLAVAAQMRWPPHLGVPAAVLVAVAATAYWAYRLYVVDPSAYGVTLGQASFRWLLLGFAAVLFMDFAASFWLIVFAQREFGLSAAQAGTQLGGLMIVGGIAGSAAGGWIADRWHEKSRAGRVWTALIAALAEAVMIVAAVAQPQYLGFVVAFACFCVSSGGWTGVAAAIGMDIVPRAHLGTAVAAYFLVTTVLGPGLGAFTAGQLADSLGSISNAVTLCCGTIVIALVAFIRLGRTLVSRKRHEAKSP